MGRTRRKPKNARQVRETTPQPSSLPAPSIPALLEKAQSLITQCDYPLALQFIERILESEPTNAAAKEMLGAVQLEVGELEEGRKTFLSLVAENTPAPPTAHLYLAELSVDNPEQALYHYQAAVDLLTERLKQNENDIEIKTLVIRALIGMVEIWMDPSYDLCFQPNAPETCDHLIELALGIDPNNPEALQALASVRISQERPEEAKEIVEKAWTSWKELDSESPAQPPLATQVSLAKLLLELHLYTPSLTVVKGILAANDEEVEALYLGGWACNLIAEEKRESGDITSPEESLADETNWDQWSIEELGKESMEYLERCQMIHEATRHPDTQLLEHTRELISQLEKEGIPHSSADDDDGEEWDDVDSSGDEDVEMS